MSPQTTRPTDDDDRESDTKTFSLRRLLAPATALSGVTLLVAAARTATENRRRAAALGVAGAGLLAWWVRRQGPPTGNDPAAPDVGAPDGDETEASSPDVVDEDDDASPVMEADDDVPAPDVDETDDRM